MQLKQTRDNLDVADERNVPENAGRFAKQCGNHSLGDQVLSALNVNATDKWLATVNGDLTHGSP
jgi:hypothetical protein